MFVSFRNLIGISELGREIFLKILVNDKVPIGLTGHNS